MSRIHPHTHESLAEGGKLDPSDALVGGLVGVGQTPGDQTGGSGGGGDPHDHSEPVEVVTVSGAAVELDYETARWWDVTLTDDCTLTIVNPPAAFIAGEMFVILRQGGVGSFTATWPAEVQWDGGDGLPGGPAPTLNTDPGAQDVVQLVTVDGGVTWGGSTDDGGPLALDDLSDVTITGPAENDTLRYVSGEWINDTRRWEPVTANLGSGPEMIFDGDDLVMEWKDY